MVNVGKREDSMLDFINAMKGRINMTQTRIAMYRETPLTANELAILNTLSALLDEERGSE
jgi:hypothetical protein